MEWTKEDAGRTKSDATSWKKQDFGWMQGCSTRQTNSMYSTHAGDYLQQIRPDHLFGCSHLHKLTIKKCVHPEDFSISSSELCSGI